MVKLLDNNMDITAFGAAKHGTPATGVFPHLLLNSCSHLKNQG